MNADQRRHSERRVLTAAARAVLALLLACSLVGCATGGRLAEYPESPQLYGGTRMHVKHFPFGHVSAWIEEGGDWSGLATVPGLIFIWWMPVDLVGSLALDTILLPVTIPAALRERTPGP